MIGKIVGAKNCAKEEDKMNGVLKYLNCISFSSAITDMFLTDKETKEQSLVFRSEKLKESIRKSMLIQQGKITKKNIDQMHILHRQFETESEIAVNPDATAMICFMLLLIENVKSHMKSLEKIEILGTVVKRLNWLLVHNLIDPKLNQHDSYVKADQYYKMWNNIFK